MSAAITQQPLKFICSTTTNETARQQGRGGRASDWNAVGRAQVSRAEKGGDVVAAGSRRLTDLEQGGSADAALLRHSLLDKRCWPESCRMKNLSERTATARLERKRETRTRGVGEGRGKRKQECSSLASAGWAGRLSRAEAALVVVT